MISIFKQTHFNSIHELNITMTAADNVSSMDALNMIEQLTMFVAWTSQSVMH